MSYQQESVGGYLFGADYIFQTPIAP